MFEDLARTTAAYRSAVDFADSRMEQELDKVLSDPRSRIGGQGDAAREAAQAKRASLVDQARAALDRDLGRSPSRSGRARAARGVRVLGQPGLARLPGAHGDPHGPAPRRPPAAESENLSIPMLVRLPLERGLWIDSGRAGLDDPLTDSDELRRLAMDTAVAHAARLLAVYAAG